MKGKGNDGSGNNEDRDSWQTNQDLWNNLNEQYSFTFDCCATEKNSKCRNFSSRLESEGLYPVNTKILNGVCWMNPPFSKAMEMFKHYFGLVSKGVCIFRCDNMETKVWQETILKKADWVFIPKGRISYTPFDIKIRGGQTRFPSALIGIGVPYPKDIEGSLLIISDKQEKVATE